MDFLAFDVSNNFYGLLRYFFNFNLLSIDFFLPSNILVLYYQNVVSRVQECVQTFPVPRMRLIEVLSTGWQRGPGLENGDRLPRAGRSKVIIRDKPTNPCSE